MRAMLKFRAERARIPLPFSEEALEFIYQQSLGVPREVLKLAGTSYHLGRLNHLVQVPLALLENVARSTGDEPAIAEVVS
jgi:hypothetical protein